MIITRGMITFAVNLKIKYDTTATSKYNTKRRKHHR